MSNDKHNEAVQDTLKYSTEQFDKNILFIASGVFAVSFAFIKDIVPDLNEAVKKDCLINSWYIFAAVIFVSLLSHFISIMANRWAIKNANLDNDNFNRKVKYWNFPIRCLNISMILAILAGAFLLIQFVKHNM